MSHSIQLASNQRDIWHDQIAHPESPLYNIGGTLIISGQVNYQALEQAISRLIKENTIFYTAINNQHPFHHKPHNNFPFNLELIDFSTETDSNDKSQQWLDNTFKQPFSFNNNDILWHFALIKESEKRYYLMTKYHHLIADGWSTTIVISRIAELYNAILNNQVIESKPPERYLDFIKKEQEYLYSPTYQADNAYWKSILPVAPSTLIPRRYSSSSSTLLPQSNIHRFSISRSVYNQINEFSLSHKSTSYHVFLIAIATYFSRIYQREDIIIGVPSLNRSGARFKDVFGMFISLSPLVLDVSQASNSQQILQYCRSRLRELYRHHRFPLGDISTRLNLLKNGRDTLFDIILSYEKHEYSAAYGDAKITAKQQFSGVSRYPLAVTICEFSGTEDVEIIFEGAENCFTSKDLQFFADRLQLILLQIINFPHKSISDLNLITDNDKKIIFKQFNSPTHYSQPAYLSVIQQFQQQVNKNGSNIAVEYQNKKLSYQQLDQLSDQLAQYLINQGIKNNNIIGICLSRNFEMLIGILATLKLSAAYLPIPLDIPDERIKIIFQQSMAQALLTTSHFKSRLLALIPKTICIDDYPIPTQLFPHKEILANTPAYIIFTSGSSGQPKGVLIDHAALSTRMLWLQSLFKVSSCDRMGQTIQYNFDPSIIEIFLSLTQGACLVLADDNCYTVDNFAGFIITKKITTVALVPSSTRLLLQGLDKNQKTLLRTACCGGERLEPSLAKQFLQQTNAKLFNVYGPTETSIIASSWECIPNINNDHLPKCIPNINNDHLPIGKPADHTDITIVDKQLNLLPVNQPGEIIIAGNTLSQGYINNLDLTKKSFPVNPHTHSRIYKTGDLGYIGYDGLLYFLGRIDRQVKISGYRIELEEIESILQLNKNVDLAAVNTQSAGEHTDIYAFIETKTQKIDSLIKELSLTLRQKLPNYMQPRKIIAASIKTTSTGKIDYTSLPHIDLQISNNKKVSPRNAMEAQLEKVWASTLLTKTVSIHENFFELGGDSLSAVSLMIAIETLTGIRQPLSFLLQYPTIAEQALVLHLKPSEDLLITLSNHSNAINIFIAASGKGDFLRLTNLAKSMGDTFNIHMLQPPEEKDLTIHSIAQYYASHIMPHVNTPYYLSGFSIGGITALETARILIKNKKSPQGIILLDSIYPRWPLQSPWLFKLIKYSVNLFSLNKIKLNNRRLEVMLNDSGLKAQLKSISTHQIKAVNLPVELILTKRMWMFHPLILSSWSKLFKNNLTRHSVNGLHGEMFQPPYLEELTAVLKKIIVK